MTARYALRTLKSENISILGESYNAKLTSDETAQIYVIVLSKNTGQSEQKIELNKAQFEELSAMKRSEFISTVEIYAHKSL
ncbi:hypothetical protein [Aliamphritea hakodatensis]|uniref:hypothetical protein n=1 Tax=Aliamphritea hakodatensis TaxID=2895352 RepID=UPI0022FD6214|nr:hypothetical protein [Aliamphritea hakodatensis]